MKVIKEKVGNIGKKEIFLFTLQNNNGIKVSFLNYGGRITSMMAPDKFGKFEEIILGYNKISEYLDDTAYLGAICGRVAGRIKNGSFFLDGQKICVTKNDGAHHLHGGIHNFSTSIWEVEVLSTESRAKVRLFYKSEDKEEGYPGEVEVSAYYELDENNKLTITYKGQTTAKTLLNLTNHTYFNLSGMLKNDILNHFLQIDSDHVLELDNEALPTGHLLNVEKTPFDLKYKKCLAHQILQNHKQLLLARNGYNHPFVLSQSFNQEIVLSEEISGRKLVVETDSPCVVVYTSSYFDDDFLIKDKPAKYLGICLETQGFPDAINHGNFPSIVLDKDESYYAKTTYTVGLV